MAVLLANRIYLPLLLAFLPAAFLADFTAGFFAAFLPTVAADPPDFFPNTLSQFLENSGLGPERTIGPDIDSRDS
jgi:hypothetical protein